MLNLAGEHLHPLLVHFPIGLWGTATALYFVSFLRPLAFLQGTSIVIGVIGTGLGWAAKWSGERAANIVGSSLCPIELLEKHEQLAETALIFFTGIWLVAALLYFLRGRLFFPKDTPFVLKIVLALGLILANVYLGLAGHKGTQLVYEHGLAVKAPIERCE